MADPVGGLGDFLKVGFDYKKMIADPDFRLGIEKIANAVKNATTSPLNLDDKVIDGMVLSVEVWLDSLKAQSSGGGLVVGAMADTPVSAIDAVNYVNHLESTQGVTFSKEVKDKVAGCPELIKLLKKRSPEYQAKLLNSAWLDTVIAWVVQYGPTLAKFLMTLLPLFL